MAIAKTRAAIGVRRAGGLVLAAVVAAGAAPVTFADPPAPIVYAKPSREPKMLRLENSVVSLPAAEAEAPLVPATTAPAPLSFDQFQGRMGATAPAPRTGAPIDLRPGMANTPAALESVSYGPSLPTAAPRIEEAPLALSSRPLVLPPQAATAFAEPYAGPPYEVAGKWYVPTHEPDYDEVGIASWYGPNFHGKDSATGEVFDENAMTAAHPTLPIPSLVRVTNLENGKSVMARLNDRGPFVDDRIIDLSRATANALGVIGKGTAKVRVQYAGPAPVEANAVPSNPSVPVVATNYAAQPLAPLAAAKPAPEVRTSAPAGAVVREEASLSGFYLQAGSFADLGNAHKLRDRLEAVAPTFVTPVKIDGAEYYRVMLGPWTSRADAERTQGRLAESGAKAIVVAKTN